MKQYAVIISTTIKQLFTYRLSFLLWRFRTILNLIFVYFLWTNIITYKTPFASYDHRTIVLYIMVINILSSIVLGTRTTDVISEILSGDISNILLKPISYFKYLIGRELGDKLLNFIFSIIEVFLLIIILKPPISIQINLLTSITFVIAVILGASLSFLISLCLSFIAFWSNDTWAPRFIYYILISLIAGTVFPLDILPAAFYNILLLTPLPYLIFLPAAIFIHGFSIKYIYLIAGALIWFVVFLLLTKRIWHQGIKNYSAYGR